MTNRPEDCEFWKSLAEGRLAYINELETDRAAANARATLAERRAEAKGLEHMLSMHAEWLDKRTKKWRTRGGEITDLEQKLEAAESRAREAEAWLRQAESDREDLKGRSKESEAETVQLKKRLHEQRERAQEAEAQARVANARAEAAETAVAAIESSRDYWMTRSDESERHVGGLMQRQLSEAEARAREAEAGLYNTATALDDRLERIRRAGQSIRDMAKEADDQLQKVRKS